MSGPPRSMNQLTNPSGPRVVVIGGGATGCGVARDLCLRGFHVTLIEFGDLGSGSSSRFHGMLQSGARYAVSDTQYAAECMREREVIGALAPQAVEPTGGLFVSLPEDPPHFAESFVDGCRRARIPCEELEPGRVMAEEPNISRDVQRAFAVPDATVHSWRLVNLLADDVRRCGGCVLMRHQVTGFESKNGTVHAVQVSGGGRDHRIEVDAVINAAGPWSARVADMLGQRVDLQLTKGAILVFAHRLVTRAINRCRPPASHDIMVPTGTVSLFGTTSEVVDDPDTTRVRPADVQALLDGAEPLIPGIRSYRALRAWAGVRPLVKPREWPSDTPLPRRHQIIDHSEYGMEGLFTVCGGSLTTHRSMAEDVGDHVCRRFGVNQPSETASTPLAGQASPNYWQPTAGYQRIESEGAFVEPLCECEGVGSEEIRSLIRDGGVVRLHDLRRRLRVGFGPCQGTFCGTRVAELLAEADPEFAAATALGRFWCERLKGSARTAWGEQARQILLSDTVYRETLGVRLGRDILPDEDRR